ncbi:MAG: beta-xylosidase, partial [Chloroflexota bacterium]|nr:beta-xylosidase [Chloroflexota bacterium]
SGNGSLEVLIYNHHDNWDMHGEYVVDVDIANLRFEATDVVVQHYRIDAAHSNAYAEWVRQGKPMYPTPEQREAIKARDALEMLEPAQSIPIRAGRVELSFTLPVHAISLLIIAPAPV